VGETGGELAERIESVGVLEFEPESLLLGLLGQ
jgi:hypothetical protein